MAEPYEVLAEAVRAAAPDANARLREAVVARHEERGDHTRWGRLCEAGGEAGLALTEYQLALRDDPEDVAALSRLAVLYEERGEADKAVESAETWVRVAGGDAEAVERLLELLLAAERFERAREVVAGPPGQALPLAARETWSARVRSSAQAVGEPEDEAGAAPPGLPTDADVVRFLHLFSGRENVYARQWAGEGGEGGYTPVREPLTAAAVKNHLLGNITVGVYPVRLDNTVTFFALDVDIRKAALARARTSVAEARRVKEAAAREAERLCAALSELGVPALLEDSGYKGRHLWVFLEHPEDAAVVRQFGGLFLRAYPLESPDLQAEFFPKQATTAGGIGNLIKLPIGIHRRTGRRSRLLLPDGTPTPDPYWTLCAQARLGRETLYAAITALKARQPQVGAAAPAPEPEAEAAPATADKAHVREAFPTAPPAWTAADFDTHREIGQLFRACAVLGALKRKVEEHRRLTHDEQVVLAHSIGHSGPGVLAVNYLLDACVDVPVTARLQSALAGNPISCPKIRKRIPHITGAVPCNCQFDAAEGQYPTPRLHLLTLPAEAAPAPKAPEAPAWDPVERARGLRILRIRRLELEAELTALETDLVRYLERAPSPEIALEDGVLRLVQEAGAPPALVWQEKDRDR
jgi:tetratricopeptide (TPR) repeat protein